MVTKRKEPALANVVSQQVVIRDNENLFRGSGDTPQKKGLHLAMKAQLLILAMSYSPTT